MINNLLGKLGRDGENLNKMNNKKIVGNKGSVTYMNRFCKFPVVWYLKMIFYCNQLDGNKY